MVGRCEDRALGEAQGHLRPGDELTWVDGVTYRGMRDGTVAVHFPDRRRRQRPKFYWASRKEEWEGGRVAGSGKSGGGTKGQGRDASGRFCRHGPGRSQGQRRFRPSKGLAVAKFVRLVVGCAVVRARGELEKAGDRAADPDFT